MQLSRNSGIIWGLISLLVSPFAYALEAVTAAIDRALDIAFPTEAARERLSREAPTSEAVVYARSKARTRSFLGRVAQRVSDHPAYGAVGLCPTA